MERRAETILYIIAATAAFMCLLFVLTSCTHPEPTPAAPRTPSVLNACLTNDTGPLPGSCGNRTTAEGYSCVLCRHDRKCLDSHRFMYCTDDLACDDKVCK
jgi:hypothetical protein